MMYFEWQIFYNSINELPKMTRWNLNVLTFPTAFKFNRFTLTITMNDVYERFQYTF